MITQTEFERLAKRMMDKQLRIWLSTKGMDFSRENQEVFVDHLQKFLFDELISMGLWQKMMSMSNNEG